MEKYDFYTEKWTPVNSNTTLNISVNGNNPVNTSGSHGQINMLRRTQFGLAVLDKNLFLVGGRDGLKTLNSVDCYDMDKDSWSSVSQMFNHRHGLQSTFLCNETILYALGGHDGWSFLNSVERFIL